MNICTAISNWWNTPSLSTSVNNAKTIAELHEILEHGKSEDNPEPAKCTLSFWCQEYVSVTGYSGSIHLLPLIDKVLQIAKYTPNGLCEFPEEERPHGKIVCKLITKLQDSTNNRFEKAYLVTKVFWGIAWAFGSPYTAIKYRRTCDDWYISDEKDMFEFYTKKQYIEKFSKQPPEEDDNCYPDRWMSQETDKK